MGLPARYVAQISVAFTARQREWLDRKQREDEMSFGEIVREAVDSAIAAEDDEAFAGRRRPRSRRKVSPA